MTCNRSLTSPKHRQFLWCWPLSILFSFLVFWIAFQTLCDETIINALAMHHGAVALFSLIGSIWRGVLLIENRISLVTRVLVTCRLNGLSKRTASCMPYVFLCSSLLSGDVILWINQPCPSSSIFLVVCCHGGSEACCRWWRWVPRKKAQLPFAGSVALDALGAAWTELGKCSMIRKLMSAFGMMFVLATAVFLAMVWPRSALSFHFNWLLMPSCLHMTLSLSIRPSISYYFFFWSFPLLLYFLHFFFPFSSLSFVFSFLRHTIFSSSLLYLSLSCSLALFFLSFHSLCLFFFVIIVCSSACLPQHPSPCIIRSF